MSKALKLTCGDGEMAAGSSKNNLVLFSIDEPGKPGDYCLVPAHEFLRVKFKNIESVDVWIEKLQEVRDYFEQ
jgi:hypothetical protein